MDRSAREDSPAARPRAPLDDARVIATATLVLGLAGALAARAGALAPASLGIAALAWIVVAVLVLAGRRHHPHPRFGAANVVTTARAGLTVLLAAFAIEAGRADGVLAGPAADAWTWIATGVAVFALVLDGIDGPLARADGTASAFGARYDMEVDALLALVLATLIWRTGELGPWVLALGTMRYAYLAAARLEPALRRPLPSSFRRKLVCVVQVAALCAIVSPVVAPPLSGTIGLAATLALALSFGVDVRWQLSAADAAPATRGDARRDRG